MASWDRDLPAAIDAAIRNVATFGDTERGTGQCADAATARRVAAEALRDLKVKEYRTLREASARVRAERAQEIRSRILAQRNDSGA